MTPDYRPQEPDPTGMEQRQSAPARELARVWWDARYRGGAGWAASGGNTGGWGRGWRITALGREHMRRAEALLPDVARATFADVADAFERAYQDMQVAP